VSARDERAADVSASREEFLAIVRSFKNSLLLQAGGADRRGTGRRPAGCPGKKPQPQQSAPKPTVLSDALDSLRNEMGDCKRCPLGKTRKNLVFGEGNARAGLVFVGEAPGADEDEQGRPFVGRAGQLLTRIIQAMGFKREDVYICNILKCRPPGNRNPQQEEIAACEPFLLRQIRAISPRFICALGTFATRTLLKSDSPITSLRGRFHDYHGIRLMPTYHPAYLLRNPDAKKLVWQDVQMIMKEWEA